MSCSLVKLIPWIYPAKAKSDMDASCDLFRYPWKPGEGIGFSGGRVISYCEGLTWMLGTELRSSRRNRRRS